MKINKLISRILAPIMALSVIAAAGSTVTADSGDWTPPLSPVNDIVKRTNKLPFSGFDTDEVLAQWDTKGQQLYFTEDDNGGYLVASNISVNYTGFDFSPVFEVEPGTYKFTGYFRTANQGEISALRVNFIQKDRTTAAVARVYITNEWEKVEFYVTLTDYLSHVMVNGGGYEYYIQDYCMDNFSFVAVDSIPEDAQFVFGTPNTHEEALESMMKNLDVRPYDPEEEKKYDVKGIIINQDDSGWLLSVGRRLPSHESIANFAKQFEGTHITDYFINVNASGLVFPSEKYTDYLEVYHKLMEDGSADEISGVKLDSGSIDLVKGAYHVFETLNTDYIAIWHEEFKKIGINPWISFRMNDVHDMSRALSGDYSSPFLQEFWYKNPQFHRVKHHDYVSYFDGALNYTYPEVREYFLGIINEALNRYNTHGIELDFQREMRLWHIGGEYAGIEILNDFMREVDKLVAVYEEKYGHEIKIAARVASDPITCEDFGMDPTTWAAEGILDMIIVGARYDNNDNDIPVRLWSSIMHPHGVEVAMNIEYANNKSHIGAQSGGHSIETFAGLANQAYSQGADKIYLFNFFQWHGEVFPAPEDRIVTDEPYYALMGPTGYWNVLTSLGSPEKLLTFDRRHILTYNDTTAIWKKGEMPLPAKISAEPREISCFRVPVGDVMDGSKLYVKFSTDVGTLDETPPVVYVNSQLCTFDGIGRCKGVYTKNKVMTYEIPESVYHEGYMLIEINSTVEFTTDYVEVYVDAPKW